jgi:hypothetical protein
VVEFVSCAPRAAFGSCVVAISQAGGVMRGWRRNKTVKTGGGNDWILLLEGSFGPSAWAEAWIAG